LTLAGGAKMKRSHVIAFVWGMVFTSAFICLFWFFSQYSQTSKTTIERTEDPAKVPFQHSYANSVCYIKREGGRTFYYFDPGSLGRVAILQINDSESKKFRMKFVVEHREEVAEQMNRKAIEDKLYDGTVWLWESSFEAARLNLQYESVRKEYSGLHPEAARFPENNPRKLQKPDDGTVERFKKLLTECAQQRAVYERSKHLFAKNAFMRWQTCEFAMLDEWSAMSEAEQIGVVNPDGYELFRNVHIYLDSRNPVRTVNEESNDPVVKDTRTVWERAKNQEGPNAIKDYLAELKKRGLVTQ